MMSKIIFPRELIGQVIEVIDAQNKHNRGMRGKIMDETKMTLTIKHEGIMKTVLKNGIVFRLLGNQAIITGKEIMKRPEERIKG